MGYRAPERLKDGTTRPSAGRDEFAGRLRGTTYGVQAS